MLFRFAIPLLLLTLAMPAAAFKLKLDFDKAKEVLSNAGQMDEASETEEIELGRRIAARLLGAAPLHRDAAGQAYLNRLGRWIALQSERPDLPWHFGILDTQAVNAFATPGGYVFVTRGLVRRLRSEAELAAVLAHEIVHVLDRHHLQAIRKQAGVGLIGGLAKLAADQRQDGEDLGKAIDFGSELYARGLDKADEFAADRKGSVLLARAGYDPYALLAVLQTLEAADPGDGALALMFKTHPTPGARITRLAPVIEAHLQAYAAPSGPSTAFAALQKRLQ